MSEQELKLKLDDVFFTQDSSAAIKLIQALKAKGSLSDFENTAFYQLQYIRIASLSIDDLVELLTKKFSVAYSVPDYDLAEKIKWYVGQIELITNQVDCCVKVISLLESHKAYIGQSKISVKDRQVDPTIANWILDYTSWPSKEETKTAFDEVEYINKSVNVSLLSQLEKDVLKNILKLYDYCVKFVNDWNSIPVPKTEAEAFEGFNLYEYIPGLDDEDIQENSSQNFVSEDSAQSVNNVPQSIDSVRVSPIAPQMQSQMQFQTQPPTTPPVQPEKAQAPRARIIEESEQSATTQLSATDQAQLDRILNQNTHKPDPNEKRGLVLDPTNVKIEDEQKRLQEVQKQHEINIQKKLADLRARNKQN